MDPNVEPKLDGQVVVSLILAAQEHIDRSRIADSESLHNFHMNTAQRALDYARDYINSNS